MYYFNVKFLLEGKSQNPKLGKRYNPNKLNTIGSYRQVRPKSQNYHNWSTIGQSGQALSSCIVKWPSPQSKAICINSGQEKPKQRSSANLTCLPKIHEAILLISRPDLIMVNLPQFAFLCNIYHRAFPP